jgi:hypothetical protein
MRMRGCEAIACVTAERRACRHARGIGRTHDQRTKPPHLLFEKSNGVVEFVAAKRVAADELGEPIGLVNSRRMDRPHFMKGDIDAQRSSLPGRLAAGKAAADDSDHWTLRRR